MSRALLRALNRNRFLPVVAAVVAIAAVPTAAQATSDPEIGVRPGQETETHADAAEAVGAEVHMALSWRKIQPTSAAIQPSDFDVVKSKFRTFAEPNGPGVGSVRIIDAPQWAADCQYTRTVKSCPPDPDHYEEFKVFVTEAVQQMGPGTEFDIKRWILWNEPSLGPKWGGETYQQGSHQAYSDLLVRFHDAVMDAPNAIADTELTVEAGEIAAGGDKPVTWAERFTQFNTARERNDNYDVLTIHAYAPAARGVVEKIKQHDSLAGVTSVGVSEFAWAAGTPVAGIPGDADYKCASTSGQRQKFRDTVNLVRSSTNDVKALVWLNVIDERKDKQKCKPFAGDYRKSVRDEISPYGLYMRSEGGGTSSFEVLRPRPIVGAFTKAAAGQSLRGHKMASYEGNSPVLAPLSALPLSGLL